MTDERIGVFICHCGRNIAEVVDVEKVAEEVLKHPAVVHADTEKYMCSDPGQKLLTDAIKEKRLTSVIVAACSPTLHEETFRKACETVELNRYKCEIANIREHCSWVHVDRDEATKKAVKIISSMVEKVLGNAELDPIKVGLNKKCLVIGGGIAGIQTALDIGNAGIPVILVEKTPSIGGHMAQLDVTFPTLDCAQCILTPKMVEVSRHPNIKLLTYSEVVGVDGFIGNFHVKIKKKSRYVDPDKCNLCAECEKICPAVVLNEFNIGLGLRKAIYIPFPQAVPATYTLDVKNCLGLNPIICGKCLEVCEPEAINLDMKDEIIEEDVGAIIVATGYEAYPKEKIGEYGYGKYDDVIDSLQFERLLSSIGPTGGEIKRPSDNKVPKQVVFIQCVGSRDPEKGVPYCSKICCMYTAKHAKLLKERIPDAQAYVFYIDIRSAGKGYEEFVQRAIEEEGILYLRGKVSKVFKDGEKIMVWGVDTLTNKKIEIEADLVVLATAMVPSIEMKDLATKLKIALDQDGFLSEAHPKLRPVESLTTGIYLAGCGQAPKDIPETVAQASGAASKVAGLFSEKELARDPTIVEVNGDCCSGCGVCVRICPYDALSLINKRIDVKEAVCEGCGACVAACPSGALQQKNLTDNQIFNMVDAVLG